LLLKLNLQPLGLGLVLSLELELESELGFGIFLSKPLKEGSKGERLKEVKGKKET